MSSPLLSFAGTIAQEGCLPTSSTIDLPAPPADLLRNASLFLDFDGTLVEIAERPDAVAVDARLLALVARLIDRLDGRVAVVSGRPVAQVLDYLGDATPAVAGSHGMEFRFADGHIEMVDRPAALQQVQAEMEALAARHPGVLVEEKPLGAALHFRQAPEAEAACGDLATQLAEAHGLHLQTGKMLYEVRTSGGDKGKAIATFMAAPEHAGMRPVFLGDDTTDEPGFESARALGGAGVLVGDPRATAASYRLADVSATLAWLDRAAEALGA